LNELDIKIKKYFSGESVYKIPNRYNVFSGKNLPSFIKDWLINKYTDSDGILNSADLIKFMDEHIPNKKSFIKNRLRTHREEVTILTRFIVETDIRNDMLKFSIPDLGIKSGEGRISDYVAKKSKEIKDGEIWGVITLVYVPPENKEKGYIELVKYRPFKPYNVDLQYYKDARRNFSIEEWIDLLIRSMEYNPDFNDPVRGFNTIHKKLLFLTRLLVFIEPNLNIIELAPKGTGKSYVFNNLSKYGWMFSGGIVSRAKLLFDISRRKSGIIEKYDFVTLDEIETIKFSDESELQGALKNYLESGKFTVADYNGVSSAGMMLLGNIQLTRNLKPVYHSYFKMLPMFFQSSALLDRFHGFIEGWKLVRINEDLVVKGYTLNVEYFSEILHSLRTDSRYSYIVNEIIEIPSGADTRDTKAIIKLASAYLKLLFPHVESPSEISKQDFDIYCLQPALEKRQIIRTQINMIDLEFKPELPDIHVRLT